MFIYYDKNNNLKIGFGDKELVIKPFEVMVH